MTVTEQARHRLHAHLEEIMGEEHAAALMEWVPDGPIASKVDIEHLREVIDLRLNVVDERFKAVDERFKAVDERLKTLATAEALANLRAELHSTLRMHTLVIIGAMGTMISLARIF